MDFKPTEEQQALADTLQRYCGRAYDAGTRRAALEAGLPWAREHWKNFAELGLHGAGLPEAVGGFGGGAIENSLIMQAFGRALVLEPFLSSSILSMQTIAALPSGPARDDLLAAAISGTTLLALAHTEPAGRGDIDIVETRASVRAGRWSLTGRKSLVHGAPLADRVLVSARTHAGTALFIVDPEVLQGRMISYRTLDNLFAADLLLDDTPAECLLGSAEHSEPAIACGYSHALVGICAEAVGVMEAALEMTVDYVRTRQQFGQTLNNFQAIQHRLADMLVELELSRSILYQGIAFRASPEPARTRALSAMKAVVNQAALFVGRYAVQMHGGIGVTEDALVSHYYRRLFVIAHQFGGESLHLARLSRSGGGFWNQMTSEGFPAPSNVC